MDSEYESIFGGINLAIHEGGHLFFMGFGSDFLAVAGGTLLQWVLRVMARVNGAERSLETFEHSPST